MGVQETSDSYRRPALAAGRRRPAEDVRRALTGGATHMLVRLEDSDALDAELLTCLRDAGRRVEERGGRVLVVVKDPAIARLLRLVLLSTAFTIRAPAGPAAA